MDIPEFESKEKILLNALLTYFEDKKKREIFVGIVNETSTISLRILDWFVTNYSKEHSSEIINSVLFKDFDVYNSYKAQLKAYNKKLFDPFCRKHSTKEKFNYYYDKNQFILTTTAQMNFFKWAIDNNIIEYVRINYEEIKRDLKSKQKKSSSSSLSSYSNSSPLSTSSHEYKPVSYIICFD